MAPISNGQLICRHCSTEMTRGLRWPKSAAIGKSGQHVAVACILNQGTKPGRKPEVPIPLSAVLCV